MPCSAAPLPSFTDSLTSAAHTTLLCSAMRSETGEVIGSVDMKAGLTTDDVEGGCAQNNYSRPDGQNCGNFLTDRPSSRVLAAPGGGSSIVFGDDAGSTIPAPAAVRAMPPTPVAAPIAAAAVAVSAAPAAPAPGSLAAIGGGNASNNYSRPDGQNCGNFLTDRKTVKVAAPPGGASQITFG